MTNIEQRDNTTHGSAELSPERYLHLPHGLPWPAISNLKARFNIKVSFNRSYYIVNNCRKANNCLEVQPDPSLHVPLAPPHTTFVART